MDENPVAISPELAMALRTLRRHLLADDLERSDAMERSDRETLTALVEAVEPLFDEINAVLDRLLAKPHPLPSDEEELEVDLNSLGQAGAEARLELARRFG